MGTRYYYNQMSKPQQAAYEAMRTCFDAMAPSARVLKAAGDIGDIFFRLRLDEPLLFYVTGISFRAYPDALYMEVVPEYMFDRKQLKAHRQAIDARLQKLLRPIRDKLPLEQEQYIHDFICQNVRYDKLKKSYSHEVIGPLQNGVGVCEGIAKTVKLMCDELGLECIIPISVAEEGSRWLHAWNMIKIGGKFYHLDVTFDNTLTAGADTIRYDYFNLDDKHIFRDHRPLRYPMPQCTDGGASYYQANHMSFTKLEQVTSRVSQYIRKKKPCLIFHWRGGYLTKEVLTELVTAVAETAKKSDKAVTFSVNWGQSITKVNFTEPGTGVIIDTENLSQEEDLI